MNEYEENNIDWFELEIMDESTKGDIKSVEKNLVNAYRHMLKFKFKRKDQGTKWVSTIRQRTDEARRLLNNTNVRKEYSEEKLNLIYQEARATMSTEDPKYKSDDFPELMGNEFKMESIRSPEKIQEFLERYAEGDNIKKSVYNKR